MTTDRGLSNYRDKRMKLQIRKILSVLALIILWVIVLPKPSTASPIPGASVVVDVTGEVTVKFLGYAASYSNDLYLFNPDNSYGTIFNNHSTPVGTVESLGMFDAGTELIFGLHVNNTGYDFYTGPGSGNPDGVPHAVVDNMYSPTETFIGFEDLFGDGDNDFNDLEFSLAIIASETQQPNPSVPEPSTVLLFCSGLAKLAFYRRKRMKDS